MSGWVGRTASDIAAAVRAGQVSAADVAREHLDRVARLDPELGAFARVRTSQAVAEAEQVDQRPDRGQLPLAGVPVAVKDNVPVAGEPMGLGSAAAPATPQSADHPVVARLRAAGAVVVGLTNLPELAIYPFTDGVFGVTRNPWDRRRTAGGSSGGAGAAVAAAMVPLAHGNDGLGSIRIPAAACGVVGVKPGAGCVPSLIGRDSWHGMSENGALATTVADAALMLGVMAGIPFDLAEPAGLRIAVSVRPPSTGLRVHPARAAAARQCGAVLSDLGHQVTAGDPPYPWWTAAVTVGRWFTCAVADAEPYLAGPGLERRTRRHVRAGRAVARVRPPRESDRDRMRAALEPFFRRCDVLIMPALAQPAPVARRRGDGGLLPSVAASLRFAPMTGVWNVAGFPAASIPAGPAVDGLPGSVQLVTGPGRESLLLSVASQLERARGWARYAPAYAPE